MNLVILFEGRYIRFVRGSFKNGKIKIVGSSIIDLFDNGLVNSDYYDARKLLPIIRQHIIENKYEKCKVKVVLNNKQVIYRELSVPAVDKSETLNLVKNEMIISLNLSEDYLVNYIHLEDVEQDDEKSQRVLATAVLSMAMSDYVNLMKNLKMKLVELTVANDAVIGLLKNISKDATTLYFDVNRSYMRLYLFDHGKYVLTRNIRTYEDENYDIEDLRRMINDNIAKMEQFQYTRNLDAPIEKVEIFGNNKYLRFLPAENYDFSGEVAVIEKRPLYGNVERYETQVNALGAFVPTDNENDFMTLLKKHKTVTANKMNAATRSIIKTLIVCISVLAIMFGALFGYKIFIGLQIGQVEDYVEDTEVQKEYAKANKVIKRDSKLDDILLATKRTQNSLAQKAKFSNTLYNLVTNSGVTVISYSFDGKIVRIVAKATSTASPRAYAKILTDSKLFKSVDYYGFTSDTSGATFNVECELAKA